MLFNDADGTIMNPYALDVAGGQDSLIQLSERNGKWSQHWAFNEADGTITNPYTGKVLDIAEGQDCNGTKIQLLVNGISNGFWSLSILKKGLCDASSLGKYRSS